MNKKILVPLSIVAVALGAAAVWAWRTQPGAEDPNQLTLYGNVDIRQVSLAFNANERIAEIRVREGERVRAGDVLAVLDQRTAHLRLAQSEAQIGVQEQALLRLKSGSRPEEIAQAHQNVTLAQAEGARKALALIVAGPRVEDIAQAGKQLAVARAEQALIQRQIEESELRAPIDAVVRARLLEPGDMASPQRPVFTLAITQPKWVRAYVPEAALGRIQPGMAVTISIDSQPDGRIPARIGFIGSVAEFTPKTVQTAELRTSLVYEVRFMVDDPKDQLRLGMPATVHLQLPATGAAARP